MSDGRVIENPATGERIVINRTSASLLSWELFLAPGGRVPSGHAHPEQEERFVVLAGQLRFRLGRQSMTAGPGAVVCVPPGTPHSFANAGVETAHVLVETRPALDMRDLLETAAWLARRGRRLPAPLDLVLFMADFRREVRAPYFGALVNAIVLPLAWLARHFRLDRGYRRRLP